MDPLTHTAAGLFLGRAGLKRFTPRAVPILLLAANIPDIDILARASGSLSYLHFHRHLTHSLIAMPLMAILPVALVRFAGRKPIHWLGAFLISLAAVAAHLLLDLTNSYGVRLLLPFSQRWFRLDLTSVVDLCTWAAIAFAIAGPFLSKLVGSEMQPRRSGAATYGRGFAIFGLFFLLLYNTGRFVAHQRAIAILESRMYKGMASVRVAAFPDLVNPLRWHGYAETGDLIALSDFTVSGDADPTRAEYLFKPAPDPVLNAAQRSPAIQEFVRFAQFPYWRIALVSDGSDNRLVEVFDLRFGDPRNPGFMASALVSPSGQILKSDFQFGRRPR